MILSAVALLATALAAPPPPPAGAVETVVRRFYTTYAAGDLEALEALWEPGSASLAAFRAEAAPLFRARCLVLHQLTFDSVEVEGEHATVTLHVLLSKSGRAMPERYDPHSAIVQLVRSDSGWRVTQWTLGEEVFAARLLAAGSDAERQAMLEAEPRLITPALARALCRLGVLRANQQRFDEVGALVWLGRRVAAMIGDPESLSLAVGVESILERLRPPGNPQRSLELAYQTMQLAEESSDPDAIAKAGLRLGRTLYAMQRPDEALRWLQRSFALRDELEDDSTVSLAAGKIAQVYHDRDDRHAAMVYAEIASATAKNDIARAGAEMNLGGEYIFSQGEPRLAIPHLRRSMELALAAGYRGGVPEAAWVLAECYLHVGQEDEALRVINRTLDEFGSADYTEAASYLLLVRSRCFVRKGLLARAEADLLESIRLDRMLTNAAAAEGVALEELASLRLAQHRYREARDIAESMMRRATAFDSTASLISARADRHLGQRGAAYRKLQRLMEAAEEDAAGVTSDERNRQGFFEARAPAYVELADMLVEDGRFDEALVVAERSKGRLLLDILRHGKLLEHAALSAAEREKEAALERRVSLLNMQSLVSPADEEQVAPPLREARRELEQYRAELCVKYPRLVQPDPPSALSIRETSALLPDSSAAFVEYFVTDSRLVIFVITRGAHALHVHTIPLSKRRLESETEALTRALAANDLHFRSRSRRLYDLILAPAAPELRGVKTIAIIPDGPLWRLPFESLVMPDGRFVIERMACFYAPSIAVYREMIRRRPRAAGNFLAFANPPARRGDDVVEAKLRDAEKGRLPDAEREVESIARMFRVGTRLYLGADALESRAKTESSAYSVIHFATHGVLDDNNPMYSHLLLATAPGSSDDGFLETWELMRLDLHAELAVLSACDTARGRVHPGEGLIGMSWALFVAGCSSAVATQWKVPSAAAADLMIDFYRQWLHPAHTTWFAKAEALRQARLHLMRDGKHADPFYWSGYVLVGSGR